jgi:multidrug resistance efflux pump
MDRVDEYFARKWQPGATPPNSLIPALVAEIERLRTLVGGDALATLDKVERERDSLARRCAVRFEETQRLRAELDAARACVAALEVVAEAARAALDVDPTSRAGAEAHIRLEAALDAAPAAETASGET